MSIPPGARLGPYEILAPLGAGGMGEVYRARDPRLNRDVAVKVLREDFLEGEERKLRFEREARALAALNHPGIAAIYSFEEIPGSSPSSSRHVLVMELVEGQGLDKRLSPGPLALEETLSLARQIAEALAYAHGKGILHRDLKPANVMVTSLGRVKLLDFGLAKQVGLGQGQSEASTMDRLTEEGSVFGTLAYMSPEQLLAKPVDQRSDLFALGIVIWEMATGKLPFEGSSKIAMADAILHAEPRAVADRPLPEKLRPIIQKLLQKDPEKRYASAAELQRDLAALQEPGGARKSGRSRSATLALAAAAIGLAVLGGWYWRKTSRERWALAQIPEIVKLVENEEFPKAVALITRAQAILPGDATLEKLRLKATGEANLDSDPAGAEVSVRPFKSDESASRKVGVTPLTKLRLPQGAYVWRLAKSGAATITVIWDESPALKLRLPPVESVPAGMVAVPGGRASLAWPLSEVPPVKLDDFAIDRTEVTNEEFRKFVDAGGYAKREYWKVPFVRDGRPLAWEQAMAEFRDATGRPGPSTWEGGTHPKGMEKHPVAGVSWYEAAAYAVFAGKELPTAFHWARAAQPLGAELFVPGSNFAGKGTWAVQSPGTLSGFGTSDMAGNVREWCTNEASGGTRVMLGGGFAGPSYQFSQSDASPPFRRDRDFGFRCVKLSAPAAAETTATLVAPSRDYTREKPVDDAAFSFFQRHYAYDRTPLNAKIEASESGADWTHETVTIDAAYGSERLSVHVFLPKKASPPFQAVAYFPGAYAYFQKKFDGSSFFEDWLDFLPAGGRAVVIPIYRGQYDRPDGIDPNSPSRLPAKWRDRALAQSKDLGRTLDYLESRKDVDSSRIAFLGFSAGGAMSPLLLGVEPRVKVAVLWSAGFWLRNPLPEVDAFNFVSRVKVPVLMLSDRYDAVFPVEASQMPFYRLLGAPDKDKKRLVYDTAHGSLPHKEHIRETLDWLDKYLGPVKR